MSQNSIVINDGTGIEVLTAINAAFDTLNTLHAGTTAPTELVVGMLWADTTTNLLKRLASTGPAVWTTLGKLEANLGMLRIDGSNQMTGPLDEKSASPASAATLDVTGGNFLQTTGSVTISALGSAQAGAHRCVRFTGSLTLTHNATSLILPAGQSIVAAAGDVVDFRSVSPGNWVLTNYLRADGSVMEIQAPDLAVANGLTNLAGTIGNYVVLANSSGAKTITSLGTAPAGTRKAVTFSVTGGASVSITCNATSLILPGTAAASNLAITDGDSAVFHSLGSGNWRMTTYQKNSLVNRLWSVVGKFASYTATVAESGNYYIYNASANAVHTLPSATSAGSGWIFALRNNNTNAAKITLTPAGGDLISGMPSVALGVGSAVAYICDGTTWHRMDSAITAVAGANYANAIEALASGQLTIPDGAYQGRFRVWGGGGGGGAGAWSFPGGNGGNGAAGGTSSVTHAVNGTLILATGGSGGQQGYAAGSGGTGGTGSLGQTNITGGSGGNSGAAAGGAGGGGGGGSSGGASTIAFSGFPGSGTQGGNGAPNSASIPQVGTGAGSGTSGAKKGADTLGETGYESGAGGGGGEAAIEGNLGGGGGGGGGYAIGVYALTPSSLYTLVVGVGGGGGGGSYYSGSRSAGSSAVGGVGGAGAGLGGSVGEGGQGGGGGGAGAGGGGYLAGVDASTAAGVSGGYANIDCGGGGAAGASPGGGGGGGGGCGSQVSGSKSGGGGGGGSGRILFEY